MVSFYLLLTLPGGLVRDLTTGGPWTALFDIEEPPIPASGDLDAAIISLFDAKAVPSTIVDDP